jgi:serine protease Do
MSVRQIGLGMTAAAMVVALAGFQGCGGDADARAVQTQSVAAANSAAAIPQERRTPITRAVERVAPAVVTVQTEAVERVANDPISQFFGGQQFSERSRAGLGSGFIIRPDGVILTNAHVVSGATRISIAMRDGTSFPAKTLGIDEANDLAVVKIDAANLPVAPLGRSDDLLVGESAIAIGNPYGFLLGNTEPTVTTGVISGTGRNLVGRAEGAGAYVDMIQTDASINPGNSGGPLVNVLGEVIGVNSSIYSPTGSSVGLGFAIPINRARRIADELLTTGRVRRPWLGIREVIPRTNNPRDALDAGVVVEAVAPGSPAARAGIQPGDRILRAGSRTLRNPFDWQAVVLDLRVGDSVSLAVRRGTRELTVPITVADLPEVTAEKVEVLRELQLVTVTPAIRIERNLQTRQGALIYQVTERISRDLGLQAGDVIVQINNYPIANADDAARAIDVFGSRGPIRMFFERGGRVYSTDFVMR